MTSRYLRGIFFIATLTISSSATVTHAMYASADQRSKSRLVTPPPKPAYPRNARIPAQGAVEVGLREIAATRVDVRVAEGEGLRSSRTRPHEMNKDDTHESSNVNSIALIGLCIAVMSVVRRTRRL